MLKGIDISNWQHGLLPSDLNIDFCICKATEGNWFVDLYCDGFIRNCINNNILWGFYHFAREGKPEDEAKFFYDNCKNYFNKGIPVLDYEVENDDNVDWCERFLQKLYDLSGVWAMLYISAYRCSDYRNSWIPKKCGLWIAGYPNPTSEWATQECPYSIKPWEFAAIWQFTSSLILKGYVGKLDGDIAYMDKNAWKKYANAKNDEKEKEKEITKTVDELAYEVYLGEYGTGNNRKKMLGKRYDEVQKRINKLYDVADEVIAGKWGNGWNRKNALIGAGYPYELIQKIVNDKLD